MSWASELEELMKSCFPNVPEVSSLNLYQEKCNWIARAIAIAESSKESFYKDIKHESYSLLFDETSTKYYKYGLFLMRKVSRCFTKMENIVLNLDKMER